MHWRIVRWEEIQIKQYVQIEIGKWENLSRVYQETIGMKWQDDIMHLSFQLSIEVKEEKSRNISEEDREKTTRRKKKKKKKAEFLLFRDKLDLAYS